MGAKDVQPFVQNAADDQADVETRSSERAILFWAIASVCGLTIGAGTKPTHDLIATMQAKAAKSA